MGDREAFLKAIEENPGDRLGRLIYADWLDDNGGHEEARSVRKEAIDWVPVNWQAHLNQAASLSALARSIPDTIAK